jgi:hypothetical protein
MLKILNLPADEKRGKQKIRREKSGVRFQITPSPPFGGRG